MMRFKNNCKYQATFLFLNFFIMITFGHGLEDGLKNEGSALAVPLETEIHRKSFDLHHYEKFLQDLTPEGVVSLRRRAEENDPFSQCILGRLYGQGLKGISKDFKKAAQWYSRAADLGDPESQYRIGEFYLFGVMVHKDPKKERSDIDLRNDSDSEFFWYYKSAEQGHVMAQYSIGCLYAGIPIAKENTKLSRDQAKGIYWLTMAAEKGLRIAQYELGLLHLGRYNKKTETEKNVIAARYWLELAREQGNGQAALIVAELAEKEEAGLTLEDAVILYEEIMTRDERKRLYFESQEAARRLGNIYFDGKGRREPEPDKAIVCFRRLFYFYLEEGGSFLSFWDYDSLYRLGSLLQTKSDEEDVRQSFWCLKKVYDHAFDRKLYPDLEFRLGRMYEEGRGTKQDDGQAAHYYKLALRKGNAEAGERLARLHAQGRGLTTLERLRGKPSTSPSSCAIV